MAESFPIKISNRKKQWLFVLLFLALVLGSLLAQTPGIKKEKIQQQRLKSNLKAYIQKYGPEAVNQMVEFRIPASVILAQAIFESGSGTSEIATSSNNHFGIKCQGIWLGDTIVRNDDAYNECFRKYESVEDSYRDHSLFLVSRKRYTHLFNNSLLDYKAWCYGLKQTGYATYPHYAEDLIKIIEEQKLYELDRVLPMKPMMAKANKNETYPPLKTGKINPGLFKLQDFSKDGLLWLDENDVLVQSIDMIMQSNESRSMAGNP